MIEKFLGIVTLGQGDLKGREGGFLYVNGLGYRIKLFLPCAKIKKVWKTRYLFQTTVKPTNKFTFLEY